MAPGSPQGLPARLERLAALLFVAQGAGVLARAPFDQVIELEITAVEP